MKLLYIILLTIITIGIYKNKTVNLHSFSRDNCNLLKGIFAILIVLTHLKIIPHWLFSKEIVSGFFFIAGYGLMYNIEHKQGYLSSFLSKRLSNILIPFIFISLLFQSLSILNNNFQISAYLNQITSTLEILPYSWFVTSILFIYICFYIIFKYIKSSIIAQLALLASSIIFIVSSILLGLGAWWRISILAFNFGIYWKYIEPLIKQILKTHKVLSILVPSIILVLAILTPSQYLYKENIISYIHCVLLFPFVFTLITYRYGLPKIKILTFLSNISYEIYLAQGISIYFLRSNIFLYKIT